MAWGIVILLLAVNIAAWGPSKVLRIAGIGLTAWMSIIITISLGIIMAGGPR